MKYTKNQNDDLRQRIMRIEDQVKRLDSLISDVISANKAQTVKPQLTYRNCSRSVF
jgi:hypothetical protein